MSSVNEVNAYERGKREERERVRRLCSEYAKNHMHAVMPLTDPLRQLLYDLTTE